MEAYWLKESQYAERIKTIIDEYNGGNSENMMELMGYMSSGDLLMSQLNAAQDAVNKGLANDYDLETLNNYVCVGSDCSEDKLYRIIGTFKNELGAYETKLIKATSATTTELGESDAYNQEYNGYLWNSTKGVNDIRNVNIWRYSNLNTKNLNEYYFDTYLTDNLSELKNMIVEHNWIVGGANNSNIYSSNAKEAYELELGKNKVQVGDKVCYSEEDNQTKINCTEEDLIYKDEIGLMYISDYMYGADSKYWNLQDCNSRNQQAPYGDYRDTVGSDWLFNNFEWTISRVSFNGNFAFRVRSGGVVFFNYVVFADSAASARPSFYLDSRVTLTEGEGSKTNPYKLELKQ